MMPTTINKESQKKSDVLSVSMAATLVLAFAVPGYAAGLPASVAGKASDGLVTLATTGNPEPLACRARRHGGFF